MGEKIEALLIRSTMEQGIRDFVYGTITKFIVFRIDGIWLKKTGNATHVFTPLKTFKKSSLKNVWKKSLENDKNI